jgi:V/A-type H+-transporting ATPase subunit C
MKYLHAHTASSHDERYAYASGRIRALEMRLLGRQRLERMAEARDIDEALRLLSDTEYSMHFDEIEDIGYRGCLKNEEQRILALVDDLTLDPEVSDILRLKYDFHNLKVALREQFSGRDLGHLYMSFARYDAEMLRAALKAESVELLPEPLVEAAKDAYEALSSSGDPAEADTIVDRAMFGLFLERAKGFGAFYVQAIVQTWIDLANIRIFMRARSLEIDSRTLPDMLIPGGFVKLTDLTETFTSPLDEVLQRFEFSPYRQIIEFGGAGLESQGSLIPLEREIDSYVISFLGLSRYFTFGLEVILAYALLKENEVKMLRLTLAAKERGMTAEAIKERIADVE